MDRLAEALIELAKQGGPVAKTLVIWFYLYHSVAAVLTAVVVTTVLIGMTLIITRTILRYQEADIRARDRGQVPHLQG